mmetsp:Transcript_6657/g.30356  ORF Transcript_6657/g.30356 Transcript_6657/m.30356 type:complete len:334 (-) Transcript_6657:1054-2055(-)
MRRARRPASRHGRLALWRESRRFVAGGSAGGAREGGFGSRRMRRRLRLRLHLPRARGPEHRRAGALPGPRAEGRPRGWRPPLRILRRGSPHGRDDPRRRPLSRGIPARAQLPRSRRAQRRRPRRRGRRAPVQVRGALPPRPNGAARREFGPHRRRGLRGAAAGGLRRARGVRLHRDVRGQWRAARFAVRVSRPRRSHVGPRGSRGAPSGAGRVGLSGRRLAGGRFRRCARESRGLGVRDGGDGSRRGWTRVRRARARRGGGGGVHRRGAGARADHARTREGSRSRRRAPPDVASDARERRPGRGLLRRRLLLRGVRPLRPRRGRRGVCGRERV